MAAGIITTGSIPKALWPGIYAFWGQRYNEHGMEYRDLYEIKSSSKSYEELVEIIGFGLAPQKNEGTSVQYATSRQGTVNRFTNKAFALGFIVTKEEIDDNQYEEIMYDRTARLAFSMHTTKEIIGANVGRLIITSRLAFAPTSLFSTSRSRRMRTCAVASPVMLEESTSAADLPSVVGTGISRLAV